ncbi:MAG: glycosyltransferase family 2 protein [Chlorobia bacterium]|nr:glycosyltransferase family 2 protein [Fimbriimonadaceae bacterium]
MVVAILILYGLLALVATLNLLLMRRPGSVVEGDSFSILIPARDEASNLAELIPLVKSQSGGTPKIYVFDDESSDGTAEVASNLGAIVVGPRESLPSGWTGKNRACHELAKAAAEDSDAKWYLFLDADARPNPDFLNAMRDLARQAGPRAGVLTGFPTIQSGQGVQPLFLAWVGWVLLAMNPFGVVSRTGLGHNRFTNGQIHAWRAEIYTRLWPNEQVKSHVLEDVMMGRLCAREGVKIEVANLSRVLKVRMYDTWRKTLDGMSKNSFEITGSYVGSAVLALFFSLCALGWLLAGTQWPIALGLLVWSGLMVANTVRSAIWPVLFMPLACLIGGFTILRSAWWKRKGKTVWKGRTYI